MRKFLRQERCPDAVRCVGPLLLWVTLDETLHEKGNTISLLAVTPVGMQRPDASPQLKPLESGLGRIVPMVWASPRLADRSRWPTMPSHLRAYKNTILT